jgi:pimeloyl-ACP methyl ester carboxylesterase
LIKFIKILTFLLAILVGAPAAARSSAADLARQAGWEWTVKSAGTFDLAMARRPSTRSAVLIVFIEGDGFAYARSGRRSMDPTPTDPLALRLALQQPGSGAVAWLARPCQYGARSRNCHSDYWSIARFAPEVIDSASIALDRLKDDAGGASRLILVGYSGGGTLAALLAQRRSDVSALVTVAANMDVGAWTTAHGLTPLSRSIDPADDAALLSHIPQVHFVGADDRIVGPEIARRFTARMAADAPVTIAIVPGQDHGCCWAARWPELAKGANVAWLEGWEHAVP